MSRSIPRMIEGIGQDAEALQEIARVAATAGDGASFLAALIQDNNITTKRDVHYIRGAYDAIRGMKS